MRKYKKVATQRDREIAETLPASSFDAEEHEVDPSMIENMMGTDDPALTGS